MSKFRGFDIRGVPYVYINREIQGMAVYGVTNIYSETRLTKIYHMVKAFVVVTFVLGGKFKLKDEPPRRVYSLYH